ncbi:MAG: YceI family protein, partial [Bacteroidota bacterium]
MKNGMLLLFLSLLFFSIQQEPSPYTLDNGHTYIGFDVERFLVGEVSGRFNECEASISMDGDDPTTMQVDATIQTESLDSNNDIRDGHLKGTMWLDAENHPTIHFKSTAVQLND